MEIIPAVKLVPGEQYYIESISNLKSRQIAICKSVIYVMKDCFNVEFTNISEVKKANGYGHSGLCHGDGSRHSKWFTFYKVHSIEYNKKIEKLYNNATNIYLQQITGDNNFIIN